MATKSYAQRFSTSNAAENCNALNNGGSTVWVGNLGKCLKEPDVYNISLSAVVAANAEVANLYIGTPLPAGVTTPKIYLQQGMILAFADPANPLVFKEVTVAVDTNLTAITAGTAQAVPIDPAPVGGLAVTDIAVTWALIRLMAPKGLDITLNAGKEATTNLNSGLKTQEVVTSLGLEGNLAMILEPDDYGFWNILHRAVTTGKDTFVFSTRPGGSYTWGNAQLGTYSRPGQSQTVQSATLAVMFQDNWLTPELYKYMSVEDKTLMRQIARLAGVRTPA
jgi:hypothetical protein